MSEDEIQSYLSLGVNISLVYTESVGNPFPINEPVVVQVHANSGLSSYYY